MKIKRSCSKSTPNKIAATLVMLALGGTEITAQEHEAHVHGLATLSVALEAPFIDLQFESPAANIVGFEHKAETKEQKQAVESAEGVLKNAKTLFGFIGTQCDLLDRDVDVSALIEDDHDHHEHEEHDHGKEKRHAEHHDHEHDHGHKDEHQHDEHDDHESHAEHSEVVATYRFECKNLDKLSAISSTLIDVFPAIEKIQSMWVSDASQGASELTAGNSEISFK